MSPRHVQATTHLSWDGTHGLARHLGVAVDLTEPPKLSTVHLVVSISFTPTLHIAEIRESSGSVRAMTKTETNEVMAFLDSIAAAAHGVVLKNTTHADTGPAALGEPCVQAYRELSEAAGRLRERNRLVACLHHHGIDYADISALLARLRADGEAVVGMAVAAARQQPPATA